MDDDNDGNQISPHTHTQLFSYHKCHPLIRYYFPAFGFLLETSALIITPSLCYLSIKFEPY